MIVSGSRCRARGSSSPNFCVPLWLIPRTLKSKGIESAYFSHIDERMRNLITCVTHQGNNSHSKTSTTNMTYRHEWCLLRGEGLFQFYWLSTMAASFFAYKGSYTRQGNIKINNNRVEKKTYYTKKYIKQVSTSVFPTTCYAHFF